MHNAHMRRLACLYMLVLSACSDPTVPIDQDLAVVTPGDTLFSAVVSGDYHSCALTMGGRAFCWGVGFSGQLGTGSLPIDCPGQTEPFAPVQSLCVNAPTPVAGGLRFARLAAGGVSTCGITPSGRLYCWGGGAFYVPGTIAPIPIGGAMRFSDVHVRDFICAIGTNGKTYCWSDRNSHGALGIPIGTTVPLDEARPVVGGHSFKNVQAIGEKGCGTTAAGSLYCWGGITDTAMFEVGDAVLQSCQAGRSSGPCTHVPLKMKGADQWSRRASLLSPCAITTTGGASCWAQALFQWGGAPFGRSASVTELLGERRPIPLVLPTLIRDIVGESVLYGACAHAVDGRVVCWGSSGTGEFGSGIERESFAVPTVVASGRAFVQLSAGFRFMCGLTSGGDVVCWGDGSRGSLGTGTIIPTNALGQRPSPTPTRVASIAGK